jgi:hypothetical protein
MEELLKRLDRADIRLAIPLKGKYPEGVIDWVNCQEKRTIEELLTVGNLGLRTGIKVGNYYFCVLDLDGKGWTRIISQQRISYVKTSKGIHIYLLIKSEETPPNAMLFYQGKRVGDFLSKGRQVVGIGSTHETGIIYQLIQRGKWFWKLESVEEIAEKLGKHEVELI